MNTQTVLQGERIAVARNGVDILAGVDITLHKGEMLGLIGPNGAGKSTLLSVLAGLRSAQGGVLLQGKPFSEHPRRSLATQIAYLPQSHAVQWPLKVQRVVELGRLPHLPWWRRGNTDDARIIDEAMHNADVAQLSQRVVTSLSGGERTRVLLARVFATQATIILADEPVASLDPYHQLHIMELMQQHARNGGAAIVVLHDLTLAARFCDRLLLLHHGTVAASGTVNEVLKPDVLAAVYGVETTLFYQGESCVVSAVRRLP
jgi:ABC-type cobalamin/Fe3+-siderophores transport system ATPase subunit